MSNIYIASFFKGLGSLLLPFKRFVSKTFAFRNTLRSGKSPNTMSQVEADRTTRSLGVAAPGDTWLQTLEARANRKLLLPEHLNRQALDSVFSVAKYREILHDLVVSRLAVQDQSHTQNYEALLHALSEAGFDRKNDAEFIVDQIIVALRDAQVDSSVDPDLARIILQVEKNLRKQIQGLGQEISVAMSSDPSNAEHLLEIQRLSELAASDACLVEALVKRRSDASDKRSVKLTQVYVPRQLEREIDKWLTKESPANLIAVVGPAGYGKTSMLWSIYEKYKANLEWCPLLVKASWLLVGIGKNAHFISPTSLCNAVSEGFVGGRRVVVLIDTVDILLHDEINRASLLILCKKIIALGASLVVSTRPEEAAQLAWEETDGRKIVLYLQPYDEQSEFPIAVSQYSSAYYGSTSVLDAELESNRIRASVASGRPLRDVCLNPLSLRMLFSIYAPFEVSGDVNVFALYCAFWRSRVCTDDRAGEISRVSSGDYGREASKVAIAMLAFGAPVLFDFQLEALTLRTGIGEAEIAALVSRGVLVKVGGGSIEFFHQTFFEHSAARGLVELGEALHGIDLLVQRVRDRPKDLFIAPILEQVLLISLAMPGKACMRATTVLSDLLKSDDPIQWSSGLSVYVMAETVHQSNTQRVSEILTGGEESVVRRYVDLVPNMNRRRALEVFDVFKTIWHPQEWQIRHLALTLAVWLAEVDWQRTREILDSNRLISEFLDKSPKGALPHRALLRLIEIGLRSEKLWAQSQMTYLLNHPRVDHVRLLLLIETHLEQLSLNEIFEVIDGQLKDVEKARKWKSESMYERLGTLYTYRWQHAAHVPTSIFSDLEKAKNPTSFCGGLNGLARSVGLGIVDLSLALQQACNESKNERRWLWLSAFVAPLLRLSFSPDQPTQGSTTRFQLIEWIKDQLSTSDYGATDGKENSFPIAMVSKLIATSPLHDAERFEILSGAPLEAWLAANRLANCIVLGTQLDISNAKNAFDAVTKSIGMASEDEKVGKYIDYGLQRLGFGKTLAARHIQWATAVGNVNSLSLAAWQASAIEIEGLRSYGSALTELCGRAMKLSSTDARRRAVDLLVLLVETGIASPLKGSDVLQLYGAERENTVKQVYAKLIGCADFSDSGTLECAAEKLLEMGRTDDLNGRRLALPAYARLVNHRLADSGKLVEQGMSFIESAFDEGEIRQYGYFLNSLLDRDLLPLGHRMTLEFLQGSSVSRLGPAGKRALVHHLSKPFERLFVVLNSVEKEQYVRLLPLLDRFIGRLIANTVCRVAPEEMEDQLMAVIDDPRVDNEIRLVVHSYRKFVHERTQTEAWAEVGEML